jgi:hypothetical protein
MAKLFFLAQETVSSNHLVYWFNQGFAVLIVLALGWAFYGWIRWAGVNLGLPLFKAHISYLDASTEGIKQATDGIKTVLANQADHHREIGQIAKTVVELESATREIASDVLTLKNRQT